MKRFLTALLIVLTVVSLLSVSAFAIDSPTPGDEPVLTAESADPNAGTVTKDPLGDNTYRLTASPAEGSDFEGWVIDGDYIIIEGDLNSTEIVIQITTNTHAIAHFSSESSNPGSGSQTSPATGDTAWIALSVMVLVLFGAVCLCSRKVRA